LWPIGPKRGTRVQVGHARLLQPFSPIIFAGYRCPTMSSPSPLLVSSGLSRPSPHGAPSCWCAASRRRTPARPSHCPFVQGPHAAPPVLSSSVLLLHHHPPAAPLPGQHGSDSASMAREPPRAAPSFSKAWVEPIFSVRSLSELDQAELKNIELRHRSDRA
jgi:hypothetical protein